MRMRLNEPGHQRGTAAIDNMHVRMAWQGRFAGASNGADALGRYRHLTSKAGRA
jgi:hypothetical protein